MKTLKTETNGRRARNIMTGLLFAGALVLFAPETGFSQGEEPVGPPKPVKIINTETEPVPVKGSVAVTGNVNLAPGTKVGIEGTANVNLVDKSVIVANTEAAPVQVRDIYRKLSTPIHGGGNVQIIFDEPQAQSSVVYTVPAGKRLVIEFIAADLLLDGSVEDADVLITTQTGGVGISFPIALLPKNEAHTRFAFTGMTKIYADAGTNVTVTLLIFDEATAINYTALRFSGYLEDL